MYEEDGPHSLLVIYYYEEEGTFQWANGDPFTFTQWGEGEPNNSGDEVIFKNLLQMDLR